MTDRSDDSLPQWTEEELALLRSADGDRPPPRSLPAALAAVGVGSAIVTSAAAAHGAAAAGAGGVAAAGMKWSGIAGISKWIAVVALGGTVVTGGVVVWKHSGAASRPASAAQPGPAKAPISAARAVVATPVGAARTQAETDRAAAGEAPRVEPAASSRPAKRASPLQPDIRLELAALDAAMRTLRAGNAAEALAALDRYDARFGKRGSLHVEATALRIEALIRAGDRNSAQALADAFLASHPRSPYAARIRALAGRATSEPAGR